MMSIMSGTAAAAAAPLEGLGPPSGFKRESTASARFATEACSEEHGPPEGGGVNFSSHIYLISVSYPAQKQHSMQLFSLAGTFASQALTPTFRLYSNTLQEPSPGQH